MSELHHGSCGVQVIDAALGKDAADDHSLSCCGILSHRQQESAEERASLEDRLLYCSIQVAVQLFVLADVVSNVV